MTSYLEISTKTRNRRENYAVELQRSISGIPNSMMSGTSPRSPLLGDDIRQTRQSSDAYEQFKNWVYVCSSYIARMVSAQPIVAGVQVGSESSKQRRPISVVKNATLPPTVKTTVNLSDVEVLAVHPSLDLLARPNYLQDSVQFRYVSTLNLLLTGECYWLIGESDDSVSETGLEMWSVPTHWIRPDHRKGPYTGFSLKPPGTAGGGLPLDPSGVIRTYTANPATMTGVWSPLHAVLRAAKVDDHIIFSQEQSFSRGINPNVIVTMAQRRGPKGEPTGVRPTLTGSQRRQLVRSIREIWGNTSNYGDPAILDGLIESVHKLDALPREMDWSNSSTINKSRIMQAFGVNPIVVGEISGSNRAQAIQAEKTTYSTTINPIIDIFSSSLTNRLASYFTNESKLLLWIEPCEPIDPAVKDKRWLDGYDKGLIGANEVRVELYGLPARRNDETRNQLLSSYQGLEQVRNTVIEYRSGKLDRQSAINILVLFLEIDESQADELLGPEPTADEMVIDDPAPVADSDDVTNPGDEE